MFKTRHIRYTALLLLLSVCLLCACSEQPQIHKGETYLDGAFYLSQGDLNVGYSFFPDGTGYLFIGSTVNPIRYGVYEQRLYLSVAGEQVNSFLFEQSGEDILLDGLCYVYVKDDPSYAASAEALLSSVTSEETAQEQEPNHDLRKAMFFALAVCLALVTVLAISRRFQKRGS